MAFSFLFKYELQVRFGKRSLRTNVRFAIRRSYFQASQIIIWRALCGNQELFNELKMNFQVRFGKRNPRTNVRFAIRRSWFQASKIWRALSQWPIILFFKAKYELQVRFGKRSLRTLCRIRNTKSNNVNKPKNRRALPRWPIVC